MENEAMQGEVGYFLEQKVEYRLKFKPSNFFIFIVSTNPDYPNICPIAVIPKMSGKKRTQ